MINIFKEEYIEVMRRALESYKLTIEELESEVQEPHADCANVNMMLVTLDQLPELIRLMQSQGH